MFKKTRNLQPKWLWMMILNCIYCFRRLHSERLLSRVQSYPFILKHTHSYPLIFIHIHSFSYSFIFIHIHSYFIHILSYRIICIHILDSGGLHSGLPTLLEQWIVDSDPDIPDSGCLYSVGLLTGRSTLLWSTLLGLRVLYSDPDIRDSGAERCLYSVKSNF